MRGVSNAPVAALVPVSAAVALVFLAITTVLLIVLPDTFVGSFSTHQVAGFDRQILTTANRTPAVRTGTGGRVATITSLPSPP
ncbi:MAG: hypothetical protein WCJ31_03845 [Planctomycetia bacterium]